MGQSRNYRFSGMAALLLISLLACRMSNVNRAGNQRPPTQPTTE